MPSPLRAWHFGSVIAALSLVGAAAGGCGDDGSGTGGQGAAGTSSTTSAGGAGGGTGGSGGATTSSTTTASGGGGSGGGGFVPMCPPEPTGAVPPLKLTEVATGLSKPVFAVGTPDDPSRLYIVEQTGLIKILKDGALLPTPFLSTVGLSSTGASDGSERGLLGLAFHPGYETNGRFFVYYTAATNGAITIAEYARSSNPDVAEPQAVSVLVEITDGLHIWGNHNGGMIAFGPDGFLYAGVGDGGGSGDPNDHGQDITTKLGKILRVDVDAHPTPPPGNLPGGDPHLWDYGLRNPWRFSFDRCTGDLYIGDVGQGQREEVDVEPVGQGHQNYGWNTMEGSICYGGGSCDMTGLTLPVAEYTHSDGCSITGGFVYRGSDIPNLVGTYFYGDYCQNRIWTLAWKDGVVMGNAEITADLLSTSLGGISSFGQDARGELYVVDIGGSVFRIEAE